MASDDVPHMISTGTNIEVDENESNGDADSVKQSTYTESLRSTLMQSVSENGRGYHKYRDGQYMLPEDKAEQDRLDLQHQLFSNTLNGKLLLAPIPDQVHNVLDLGTGTGIWAIDFADQHPEAQVLGIDLSPIQPSFTPPNCKFEVDDFEESWTFPQKFDVIHGRMIIVSYSSPQKLFKDAFNALKPGGWFEMQDLCMPMTSDDGSHKGTTYEKWNDMFMVACRDHMKRDPTWPARYKEFMEEAGFINVELVTYKWPQNSWPKDPLMKDRGRWNLINTLDGMEAFTMRLFNMIYQMSADQVHNFLDEVRKDLFNKKIHAYWPIYIAYGQKPLN